MWSLILSTIVFFVAAYFLNRYLDDLGVDRTMSRTMLVGVLATIVSIPCLVAIWRFSRVWRDAMQGANCAVWPYHTSNLERSSAPARRWINR